MARRGRKTKPGDKREPSGKLSRKAEDVAARLNDIHDKEEREALSVGLEARMRLFKVEAKESRNQMAGSFIGRLCLQRVISRPQYEAAITYAIEREAYLRAVAPAQGGEPRAFNPNATHGRSHYENEARTQQDVARYRAAYAVIVEAWRQLRGQGKLLAAVQCLIVDDQPVESLVPDLRQALNALVKHYGLEGRRAA